MGADNDRTVTEVDNKEHGASGTNGADSGSPSPTGTGGTGGTGGTRGTGADGGTGNQTEAKLPVLVNVTPNDNTVRKPNESDEAYKKRCERNARRRERYEKEKAQSGKPVKVNAGKKATTPVPLNDGQIFVLIKSFSSMVASRPGMELWALTDAEIKSLSDPLGAMIAKADKTGIMAEHAEAVALIMACGTILLPRMIMTMTMRKEKKRHDRTGQQTNTNPAPEPIKKGKDIRPVTSSSAGTSSNGQSNDSILSICGSPTA